VNIQYIDSPIQTRVFSHPYTSQYKYSVRTSQETHSLRCSDQPVNAVYCENHKEHKYILWAECRVLCSKLKMVVHTVTTVPQRINMAVRYLNISAKGLFFRKDAYTRYVYVVLWLVERMEFCWVSKNFWWRAPETAEKLHDVVINKNAS
jgi:hypothetical protein